MKDEPSKRPERPSKIRDLIIKNMDSATARILEDWLEEKAQQEKYKGASDIFSETINELLYRELGVDGVTERYKKFQEEQRHLRGKFIEYCEKTGYDPDAEAYAEAYPDEDSEPNPS